MGLMGRSSHPKHVANFVLAWLAEQPGIRLPDVLNHIMAGFGTFHICLRDSQRVEVQAKRFVAEPYHCESFTRFETSVSNGATCLRMLLYQDLEYLPASDLQKSK